MPRFRTDSVPYNRDRFRIPNLAVTVLLTLSACAMPQEYFGVGFAPGAAPNSVQTLAVSAMAGDPTAQLRLGIAYEEGDGIPQDLGRAVALYRMVAASIDSPELIAVDAPGQGSTYYVATTQTGGFQARVEAARRLQQLGVGR